MIKNHFIDLYSRKEAHERRRISFREASKESGVSVPVISAWYHNDVKQYHAKVLDGFCAWLGCQVGDLLEYVPGEGI